MKVFNALGCEIATLVSEKMVPGNYVVTFNSDAYSSGVYFYVLKTGNYTRVKKMIIQR